MANKKQDRVPIIKNPKIGKSYKFRFAGSNMYGQIISVCESLTKLHGHNYYWFNSDEDPAGEGARRMTYPISIYDILSENKNV